MNIIQTISTKPIGQGLQLMNCYHCTLYSMTLHTVVESGRLLKIV